MLNAIEPNGLVKTDVIVFQAQILNFPTEDQLITATSQTPR